MSTTAGSDPEKRSIPSLPDEWIVSINKQTHVSILDRETGRSVAAFPTPEIRGWTVLCLANYPDNPVLAKDVTEIVALRGLRLEAEAVNQGKPSIFAPEDAHDYKRCEHCNRLYIRHPSLEVRCPMCDADVGNPCQRPSGHDGPFVDFHADRGRRAVTEGVVFICPDGVAGDAEAVRRRCEHALGTATTTAASRSTEESTANGASGQPQATLDSWGGSR